MFLCYSAPPGCISWVFWVLHQPWWNTFLRALYAAISVSSILQIKLIPRNPQNEPTLSTLLKYWNTLPAWRPLFLCQLLCRRASRHQQAAVVTPVATGAVLLWRPIWEHLMGNWKRTQTWDSWEKLLMTSVESGWEECGMLRRTQALDSGDLASDPDCWAHTLCDSGPQFYFAVISEWLSLHGQHSSVALSFRDPSLRLWSRGRCLLALGLSFPKRLQRISWHCLKRWRG